jgi:hypothetical protein
MKIFSARLRLACGYDKATEPYINGSSDVVRRLE